MSYIRVMLRGTLPNGEVWSVNPAYNETTNVATWDQVLGNNAAQAIALIEPPADLRSLASVAAPLASVRIERRSDGGALIGAAETPYIAGWSTSTQPTKTPQTACVISLRTATPGSSGRGRLYWPALGATINTTTLRFSLPGNDVTAPAASSYLDAIETALKEELHATPSLIDLHLCVVSPTTGQRHDVDRIEVGNILDTQRRRRDRMIEARYSVSYP